jgi:ATP-dependent helicase/nuclease subunit A
VQAVEDGVTSVYAFRRNLVLAASAGTGKTHSLVGVVVHLVLGASELGGEGLHAPVLPSRIVATTFSRKAAAEIRSRVVDELERLANRDPSAKYRRDLDVACARVGLRAWDDDFIAERARRALTGLSSAQIGTLHSFAASLVKAHAFELGLSPGFELAEEDETRARVDDAIARVLEAHALRDEAAVRDQVNAAGGVDRLVAQIARALARLEEDGRGAASLVIDPRDARAAEAQMRALVDHARGLESDAKLAPHARAVVAAFAADDADALAIAAEEICAVSKAGKKSPAAEDFFLFRDELTGDTNRDRGRRLACLWRLRDRFAGAAAHMRALLVDCEDEIRRATIASSSLGFGDVLRAARDLLRDHPDVAAEVASEIDVLLVDEFQDTSRLQRELVQLLWAKDPARRAAGVVPHVGALRGRGLFVVGDRKQSIYGFRGADVSVFAELCVGLAGAPARKALGIAAGVAWEPEEPSADFVPLCHNRRGRDELLTFANALSVARFRPGDGPAALYEIAYMPPTEDLLPPPERPRETEPSPRTTWLRVPPGARGSMPIDEACVIAERVQHILAHGEPSIDGAPPRCRDIAVLAETNRMLDATAYALAQAGVPYVVAGKGFYGAREVRDLAAMLALVVDPSDALAMLEVLRGPWAGVRDQTLIALTDSHFGLAEVGSRWDAGDRRALVHPDDRDALDDVRRVVLALRTNVDRLGPGGVLREAVRALALEETLVQLPRGAQRVANVRKLIAMAERETGGRRQSARAFLDRLNDAADREASESEAATFSDEDDAVRLLTVHASKGLDFPIVFVPQVGSDARPIERGALMIETGSGDEPSVLSARIADADGTLLEAASYERAVSAAKRRDRAERQRLTYVAVTRASHAMLLVGDRSVPQKGESESFTATTAAALRALAEDDGARARAMLNVEEVTVRTLVRDGAFDLPPPEHDAARMHEASSAPRWRSLPIATTALQDFHHCPRRFQLVHLLDLPEETPPWIAPRARDAGDDLGGPHVDARAEGTLAHRVLERVEAASFGRDEARARASRALEHEGIALEHEKHAVVVARVMRFLGGAYAARIAGAGASILREHPFVFDVLDGQGRAVAVRGTIDLLVRWPDGAIDVIDYKRARGPSAEPYAFQLDAYVLAARALFPDAKSIRAGIVFLGGDASEPIWRSAVDVDHARARFASLGERLVDARWSERFPRVALPECHAIHCGYVSYCHPRETP